MALGVGLMVLLSGISVVYNRASLLLILISLEMFTVSLFILIFLVSISSSPMNMFSYLVFSVCEACMGLVILVLKVGHLKVDLMGSSSLC